MNLTPLPPVAPIAQPVLQNIAEQQTPTASHIEARIQDLMLQLRTSSLHTQELAYQTQGSLRKGQVQIMQQLASSSRWDGVRSMAFGLLSGASSCAAPFAPVAWQQPLQVAGSTVLPQVGNCFNSFAEASKMPRQLERSHLEHRLQLASSWLQQLQGQEQRISEIYRSCLVQVRS